MEENARLCMIATHTFIKWYPVPRGGASNRILYAGMLKITETSTKEE